MMLAIIQATPFCPLACSYCYLPSRDNRAQMSEDVLTAVLTRIFECEELSDEVSIVWHAGEPLALPIDFYERAFATAEVINARYRKKFHHSLQTSAVLINDRWARLFKTHDVRVGVSLDGPQFIHDKHRKTRAGKGTHQHVMRGVDHLLAQEVPVHVIAVLTAFALEYPDEMFHFFVDSGVSRVAFNIDEIESANKSSSYSNNDVVPRYKAFIKRFLTLLSSTGVRLSVREFEGVFSSILYSGQDQKKCFTNIPLGNVSFDHLGNFTTFSPELLGQQYPKYDNFVMGNVLRDSLASVFTNETFIRVNTEIQAGVRMCRESCDYWDFCGGGHPSNKVAEHGTFAVTETLNCRMTCKTVVDTVLEFCEEQIRFNG